MKILALLIIIIMAGLITIVLPQTIVAQKPLAKNANMAAQIIEARKANAALMRQYSWNSRTEFIEKGEVKDTHIDMVGYGPDGQLFRTPLNDQGASLPGGFLRRAIAEKERKKMEEYLTGLRSLLDQYTLPTAGKVLDFINQATTTGPDASGMILMTGNSVVLPGDTLSLWTNATTQHTQKVEVTTFYQGDVAMVTATFNTLYSGMNYMAYAEVKIPAREIRVHVQNVDFFHTELARSPQKIEQKPSPTPPAAPSTAAAPSLQVIEKKLQDLKTLMDKGLITQSEYDAKKAQILKEF
jgi:hypothetical protein